MDPIAFDMWKGFSIHWYGVWIAVGFLASVFLMLKVRKYADISDDNVYSITMLALIAGILGARIFYAAQFHEQFFDMNEGLFPMLFKLVNIRTGGIVFYGGFIGGFTAICIYSKRKKIDLLALLDILAPAIILAHGFGRIGCFMQGCCCGGPAPEWFPCGITYPHGSLAARLYPAILSATGSSVPVYPVQLFEAAGNFILCGFLLWLLIRKRKFNGMIAAAYLVLYGVLRFLLEFLRGDHTDFLLGMTPAQNIALFLMLPTAIVIWIAGKKCAGKTTEPETQAEGSPNEKENGNAGKN